MEPTYVIEMDTGEVTYYANRDHAAKGLRAHGRNVLVVRTQDQIEHLSQADLLKIFNRLSGLNEKKFADKRSALDRVWARIIGRSSRRPINEYSEDPTQQETDDMAKAKKKAGKSSAKKSGPTKIRGKDARIKVLHKGENPWREPSVAWENWPKIKDGALVSEVRAAGVRALDIARAVERKHISLTPVKSE